MDSDLGQYLYFSNLPVSSLKRLFFLLMTYLEKREIEPPLLKAETSNNEEPNIG
jgi:hypothetical protein